MTDKFRVFIAGPMSAYPNYNFPLFDFVAEKLTKTGQCEVFNPAQNARSQLGGLEIIQKMGKAELEDVIKNVLFPQQISWLCRYADAVLMLPGWQHSEGAKIEHAVAHYFKKVIREADTILLMDEKEARHLGSIALELAEKMT